MIDRVITEKFDREGNFQNLASLTWKTEKFFTFGRPVVVLRNYTRTGSILSLFLYILDNIQIKEYIIKEHVV